MGNELVVPGRRLGRHPKKVDARTFQLARFLDLSALPRIPTHRTFSTYVQSWPMYLNDQLGDCTCAEVGHQVQLWTALQKHLVNVTDQDVLRLYEAVGGYVPGQPDTDQGAVILDVLNYWRHAGIAGHRIGAFAEVDVHDHKMVKAAIDLFEGLDIGAALPIAAQAMGRHWVKPPRTTGSGAPGSWGGHCVAAVDYSASGVTVVTWGELTRVTWGFWDEYVEEAWACISNDFLDPFGRSIDGFDAAALVGDLGQVRKVDV